MGIFVGVLEHDSPPNPTLLLAWDLFHFITASAPTSPSSQQDPFKEWVGKGMPTLPLKHICLQDWQGMLNMAQQQANSPTIAGVMLCRQDKPQATPSKSK